MTMMVMNFRFYKFSCLTEQVFDLQERFRFMECVRVVICGCPMLTEISEGKVAGCLIPTNFDLLKYNQNFKVQDFRNNFNKSLTMFPLP